MLRLCESKDAEMNSSAARKQAQNHPQNGKVTVNAQPSGGAASELKLSINDIGSILPTTSLSFTYNRVHIDFGTFLAKSPSSINSDWKTSGTGCEFLDHHSAKFFEFIGAKRKSKKKVELLDCILANLLSAYGSHSQLLYSRMSAHNPDYLTTIQITDYLEHCGLVVNVIGKANEYEGNQSWMAPTELFKLEIERAKVRVGLRKNYSMLEIRGEDGQPLSITRFKSRHVLDFKSISTSVQMYNQSWLDHDATLFGRPVVPFCRRIFNGDLNHGGRFYGGGHLTLPKDKRAQICIDGEVTIEPDFKSIHYCLLYAMKGIELNPVIDDPYCIEGFDRKTAKLASLILLNSELSRFRSNITKSGNPDNKAIIAQYKEELTRFIMRSSQRLPAKRPIKPKLAHGFIEGMPDHINGADLLDAISQRHSAIADLLGTDRIGLKLQNSDSRIMAATLTQLAAVNIPVLPIHDSLRCRLSDLEATMSAMKLAYKSVTGMNGFIAL